MTRGGGLSAHKKLVKHQAQAQGGLPVVPPPSFLATPFSRSKSTPEDQTGGEAEQGREEQLLPTKPTEREREKS